MSSVDRGREPDSMSSSETPSTVPDPQFTSTADIAFNACGMSPQTPPHQSAAR